jgi:DNA-binding transcriptional MerR regulator
MTSAARYAIGDLARLAGVSRRTVRYYVQENLIPAPLGVGRGDHYGPEHLERILRVKTMQEAGKTLDEIRQADAPQTESKRRAAANREPPAKRPVWRTSIHDEHQRVSPERSIWRRLTLAPGVELQIAGNVRLPSPGRLQELAEWCRLHLVSTTDPKDEANDA